MDQLSLTAWMPAVMLVATLAVLMELRHQRNYDVGAALGDFSDKGLGVLVPLLFAVLIAAVVTQAFAFESIRLLEGYLGRSRIAHVVLRLGVRHHRARLLKAMKRVQSSRESAFDSARRNLTNGGFSVNQVRIIEDDYARVPEDERPQYAEADVAAARSVRWQQYADADLLGGNDRWIARVEDYPGPHRLLPTKLGNVLRATEDQLGVDGTDLEDFVMRNYDLITSRLLHQHDQFRDRLEMYCTLVVATVVLTGSAVGLLYSNDSRHIGSVVAGASFLLLTWLCYEAAVASARGYASALRVISKSLEGLA